VRQGPMCALFLGWQVFQTLGFAMELPYIYPQPCRICVPFLKRRMLCRKSAQERNDRWIACCASATATAQRDREGQTRIWGWLW
jgi:hypothetical protein